MLTSGKGGGRLRVAMVVQRCGREVNGGAETLCLAVAQRMAAFAEVEVLTTCALDYLRWEDHYPAGVSLDDGVPIRRFPVAEQRDPALFNPASERLAPHASTASLEEQEAWMRLQGPWSPELFDHIARSRDDFDVFVFFGYLYAQTWFGLPAVADKALLAPLAHDEWTLRLNMMDRLFAQPRGLVFNTVEELEFVRTRFPAARIDGPVIGLAVDRPADTDPVRFRRAHRLDDDFLLYVGRIDPSKGCDELFSNFLAARSAGIGPPKLVLLGKPAMEVPAHPDILALGFVSEQTKWDALAACEALVMPSRYESLSLVLLEAWAVGKPVLVNAASEVLVGQCRRANGGLWYGSAEEYQIALRVLLEGRTPFTLGRQGWEYVRERYRWPVIDRAWADAIASVAEGEASPGARPRS